MGKLDDQILELQNEVTSLHESIKQEYVKGIKSKILLYQEVKMQLPRLNSANKSKRQKEIHKQIQKFQKLTKSSEIDIHNSIKNQEEKLNVNHLDALSEFTGNTTKSLIASSFLGPIELIGAPILMFKGNKQRKDAISKLEDTQKQLMLILEFEKAHNKHVERLKTTLQHVDLALLEIQLLQASRALNRTLRKKEIR